MLTDLCWKPCWLQLFIVHHFSFQNTQETVECTFWHFKLSRINKTSSFNARCYLISSLLYKIKIWSYIRLRIATKRYATQEKQLQKGVTFKLSYGNYFAEIIDLQYYNAQYISCKINITRVNYATLFFCTWWLRNAWYGIVIVKNNTVQENEKNRLLCKPFDVPILWSSSWPSNAYPSTNCLFLFFKIKDWMFLFLFTPVYLIQFFELSRMVYIFFYSVAQSHSTKMAF